MKIFSKGTVVHLHGDLTYSGMTRGIIDALDVSLHRIGSGGEKNIRIDCSRIRTSDISGLQLLYVWMQCAGFRGVEPELVNLSDSLQQAMQMMEVGHCFTGNSVHPVIPDEMRAVPGSRKREHHTSLKEEYHEIQH
jgi:ABC-type transporter Mla MlaB component